MNKPKLGGSYIERELYQSKAFMSLKAFSVKLLILFFDKRKRESRTQAKDKKGNRRMPKFINLGNIAMPYAEIEKKYGIKRQTITRAIDDLLAKGFIEIRHHGGCCQHDKTIYALVDSWMLWTPSTAPFSVRQRDVRRGYQGKKVGAVKN